MKFTKSDDKLQRENDVPVTVNTLFYPSMHPVVPSHTFWLPLDLIFTSFNSVSGVPEPPEFLVKVPLVEKQQL